MEEKKLLMDNILKIVEVDNKKFLQRLRNRTDRWDRTRSITVFLVLFFEVKRVFDVVFPCRVGIDIPKIEVRYEHLSVGGDVYVGSRALPTLFNATMNIIEVTLLHRSDELYFPIFYPFCMVFFIDELRENMFLNSKLGNVHINQCPYVSFISYIRCVFPLVRSLHVHLSAIWSQFDQQTVLGMIRLLPSKKRKIQILKDISGIVKPSRYLHALSLVILSCDSVVKTILGLTSLHCKSIGWLCFWGRPVLGKQRCCWHLQASLMVI